jgi:ribose 5-phosphate isomerase B
MHATDDAVAIVETFLTTAWSREDRQQRRIDLLLAYEATGGHA